MNNELEQAWNDLQAVPSYVERVMSQEEQEEICYQVREVEERIQQAAEEEMCWRGRSVA